MNHETQEHLGGIAPHRSGGCIGCTDGTRNHELHGQRPILKVSARPEGALATEGTQEGEGVRKEEIDNREVVGLFFISICKQNNQVYFRIVISGEKVD